MRNRVAVAINHDSATCGVGVSFTMTPLDLAPGGRSTSPEKDAETPGQSATAILTHCSRVSVVYATVVLLDQYVMSRQTQLIEKYETAQSTTARMAAMSWRHVADVIVPCLTLELMELCPAQRVPEVEDELHTLKEVGVEHAVVDNVRGSGCHGNAPETVDWESDFAAHPLSKRLYLIG
jgi:hypothetical protein